jgi:lipid-A-disaccharide synthase-like uncharacterized protein
MIKMILPLVDWFMGIVGGVVLLVVFGGLALWLIIMMNSGKKK